MNLEEKLREIICLEICKAKDCNVLMEGVEVRLYCPDFIAVLQAFNAHVDGVEVELQYTNPKTLCTDHDADVFSEHVQATKEAIKGGTTLTMGGIEIGIPEGEG